MQWVSCQINKILTMDLAKRMITRMDQEDKNLMDTATLVSKMVPKTMKMMKKAQKMEQVLPVDTSKMQVDNRF